MTRVLVIDDEKSFPFPDDWDVVYARTLDGGYYCLDRIEFLDELWLDHDLGGEDTIRPLALMLAESAFNGMPYSIAEIVVCSLNLPGQRWIESTLSPYYRVSLCTSPLQLLDRLGSRVAKWY